MTKPSFDLNKVKDNIKNFKFTKATFKKMLPYLLELVLFAFIITFDLCMKDYLVKFLSKFPNMNYVVAEGFMDLYYSENTGAGFGMFKDNTLALTIVTAVVIAAVLIYLAVFHSDSEWLRIPLVMISAGGIGNLVDRISLGYVRDFFEFTFVDFAIFNIADAFVTVGSIWLVLYLIYMIFKDTKTAKEKKNAAEAGDLPTSVESGDGTDDDNGSDNGLFSDDSIHAESDSESISPFDEETDESSENSDDASGDK